MKYHFSFAYLISYICRVKYAVPNLILSCKIIKLKVPNSKRVTGMYELCFLYLIHLFFPLSNKLPCHIAVISQRPLLGKSIKQVQECEAHRVYKFKNYMRTDTHTFIQ